MPTFLRYSILKSRDILCQGGAAIIGQVFPCSCAICLLGKSPCWLACKRDLDGSNIGVSRPAACGTASMHIKLVSSYFTEQVRHKLHLLVRKFQQLVGWHRQDPKRDFTGCNKQTAGDAIFSLGFSESAHNRVRRCIERLVVYRLFLDAWILKSVNGIPRSRVMWASYQRILLKPLGGGGGRRFWYCESDPIPMRRWLEIDLHLIWRYCEVDI